MASATKAFPKVFTRLVRFAALTFNSLTFSNALTFNSSIFKSAFFFKEFIVATTSRFTVSIFFKTSSFEVLILSSAFTLKDCTVVFKVSNLSTTSCFKASILETIMPRASIDKFLSLPIVATAREVMFN